MVDLSEVKDVKAEPANSFRRSRYDKGGIVQRKTSYMSNKAKIREEAKKLNLIDDLMFRKMAEDGDFCQEILRVIMNDPQLVVVKH